MDLVQGVLAGDRLALARLLTNIENDTPQGREALDALFPSTGGAHLIGVTGAPGTGKSSLVNQLARHYRQAAAGGQPPKVGIVAVDPSSPFTGGALLGDRVRMRDLAGDPGVFIRSMASRGSLGGLAATTGSMVQVLDAAGFELILIETVGAGQAEVDIARLAHTTLVVEAPGLGDDIQAIKAGILEIADILVINKADRPGVENTERALRGMLQLARPASAKEPSHGHVSHHSAALQEQPASQAEVALRSWDTPIHRTIATEAVGIAELVQSIAAHRAYLEETDGWRQRERNRWQSELDALLKSTLVDRWRHTVHSRSYEQILEELIARRISPWQAVHSLLGEV